MVWLHLFWSRAIRCVRLLDMRTILVAFVNFMSLFTVRGIQGGKMVIMFMQESCTSYY